MQNILRWKFNLNFPAKFDLSVAGHQNWQRPAQLKYFMNIHKQLTILNNDQINTNFLWRTCFYGRNSVFEDDNMYFHICSLGILIIPLNPISLAAANRFFYWQIFIWNKTSTVTRMLRWHEEPSVFFLQILSVFHFITCTNLIKEK